MQAKHRKAFDKFTSTFPLDVITKWDTMVEEWNVDKTKPNPYEEPVAGEYCAL